MSVQVAIALYSRGATGSFHWAMAVQDSDRPLTDPLRCYQIADERYNFATRRTEKCLWFLDPYPFVRLLDSSAFVGCVMLSNSVGVSLDTFTSWIEQYPAHQDGFRLPRGWSWSCSWWVIRAVRGLEEVGLITISASLRDNSALHARVIARGASMQLAAKAAGQISVHDL